MITDSSTKLHIFAQLALTLSLLIFAVIFEMLGDHDMATALVGAVLGQGAGLGVKAAVKNGNGG